MGKIGEEAAHEPRATVKETKPIGVYPTLACAVREERGGWMS